MEYIPAIHAAKVGMRYPARAGQRRNYGMALEVDLTAIAPGRSPRLFVYLLWDLTVSPEIAQALVVGQSVEVVLVRIFEDETGDLYVSLPADPAWLAWNGGTVRQLAQRIRETGESVLLPVLADALEEAGCAERDLLARCRNPDDDDLTWLVTLLATQE